MKILTIDRAEGDFFVCYDEHQQRVDIARDKIPGGKSGDVVIKNNGAYEIDEELTEKRRKEIISMQESLWE